MIRTKHHVGAHSIHSAGRKANPAHASANALNHTLINLISVPEAKNCAEKIADGRREGWMIADEDDEMGGPKAIKSIFVTYPGLVLFGRMTTPIPSPAGLMSRDPSPLFENMAFYVANLAKCCAKHKIGNKLRPNYSSGTSIAPNRSHTSRINFIRTPRGSYFSTPNTHSFFASQFLHSHQS